MEENDELDGLIVTGLIPISLRCFLYKDTQVIKKIIRILNQKGSMEHVEISFERICKLIRCLKWQM